MTQLKIDIFDDLDALLDGLSYDQARERMKEFRCDTSFHGVWYDPNSGEWLSEDYTTLNIIADWFDGVHNCSCLTGFYWPNGDSYDDLFFLSIEY